ncbi:MAG: IS30 family transposase [Kiritimatiellae bacterium]|nr:IS30 family transposase [Kiritimatiellia bacterium]
MTAKTSGRPQTGAPKYHRLTAGDRTTILIGKLEGKSAREIARELGVAPSTVARELQRNACGWGTYRNEYAQRVTARRAAAKAAKRRKFTEEMWRWAMERLALGWSFAAIVGRARLEGVPMVCAETLYKEYYKRQKAVAPGQSKEVLPPLPKAHRKRHRRGKRYTCAGRGRIPGRVDISERPAEVETRKEVGHAEGDLINGAPGTGHLVTVTERSTRFTWFARVGSKEDSEVARALVKLLSPLPKGLLKTLTFDNGKEFARFKQIEKALGIKAYFAKPYHSWERGTNENRNGVVRRILPKGTSFADIPDEAIRRADARLNDRPLRCLDWRTPREALAAHLADMTKNIPAA